MNALLSVEDLNFSYKEKSVFKGVSFDIAPQEFVAIVGPNGCGKTTLIKTILKNETPDKGVIRVKGNDISNLNHQAMARLIAAVFQTIDPAAITVRDYVLLGRMPYFKRFQFFETRRDNAIADRYMEMTGIRHLADSKVTQISGGERQLCAIARALTQEPELLVLDEPTSHLDITHQKRIMDLITQLKDELSLTIFMVLHDLNLASEYADRLVLLCKKKHTIYSCGKPETVLTRENLESVYSARIQVKPNPVSGKPWCIITKGNPS